MGKFKLTGDWYIDGKYGSDAQAGNKAAPFATVGKAESVAAEDDTFIIGSGSYSPLTTTTKSFNYIGEGTVLFDGTGLGSGIAINNHASLVLNITFFNYNGTSEALQFGKDVNKRVIDCRFFTCDIDAVGKFDHIKNCDFVDCDFLTGTPPEIGFNYITQCNFISCTGNLQTLVNATHGIFNTVFSDCDGLDVGISSSVDDDNAKFNYNNVEGTLDGSTQQELIDDRGANANGQSEAIADIFNDYDGARAAGDYWKQDLTQKLDSPVLDKGRGVSHIGNDYKANFYSAVDLWNTHKSAEVDMQLVGDVIKTDAGAPVNNQYTSVAIDTGATTKWGKLRVRALIEYSSGSAIGYYFNQDDQAPNPVVDQKTTHNLALSLADPAPIISEQFEENWDIYIDGTNDGTGGANDYSINDQDIIEKKDVTIIFSLKTEDTELKAIAFSHQPTYIKIQLADRYGHVPTTELDYKLNLSNGEIINKTTVDGCIFVNEELVTSIDIIGDSCYLDQTIDILEIYYIENSTIEEELSYDGALYQDPDNLYNFLRWNRIHGITYPFAGTAPTTESEKAETCTGCPGFNTYVAQPYETECSPYRPVLTECDGTNFFINSENGISAATLGTLRLDVVDRFWNTIQTDVNPVQQFATGVDDEVKLYSEGVTLTGLKDCGFYMLVITDTTAGEAVYVGNEFVFFEDNNDINKLTSYLEYRNSEDIDFFEYEGLPNYENKIRLHLYRISQQRGADTEQYQEETTGKTRNLRSTPQKTYTIETYFFDDAAHDATGRMLEHDGIVLNRLAYTKRSSLEVEFNADTRTHKGTFDLFLDRFASVNKFC